MDRDGQQAVTVVLECYSVFTFSSFLLKSGFITENRTLKLINALQILFLFFLSKLQFLQSLATLWSSN